MKSVFHTETGKTMDASNPFEALRALRDTLPDATDSATDSATTEAAPGKAAKPLSLTIFFERRRGKDATIIVAPDDMDADTIRNLAGRLKRTLGTGGSVRDNEILLQGDRRSNLQRLLSAWGYRLRGNLL